MNTATQQASIFHQDLDHFRELLPNQKLLYEYPEDHPLKPLLDNYLSFYNIDFSHNGMAKNYSIWKSQVSDDHTIVQQYWEAAESKGLVVITHGYFDHTGLYGPLIQYFLANHFSVICFDLPGNGLSSSDRGLIHNFNEYSHSLDYILRQAFITNASTDEMPLILAGQSTGGAIIANYLLNPTWNKHTIPTIKHCIFLAPLVRINACLLYTSPSPRDRTRSRMPSSA